MIAVALFLLWFVYYYIYVPAVIKHTRCRLFGIRDGLMDCVMDNRIQYESELHQTMRTTLNHLIQDAHKLSWIRAIVLTRSIKKHDSEGFEQFVSRTKELLDSLPEYQREIYIEATQKTDRAIFLHMCTVSLGGMILFITGAVLYRTAEAMGFMNQAFDRAKEFKKKVIDSIELLAFRSSITPA